MAVERYIEDKYKDENGTFLNFRSAIKAQVKQDQKNGGREYNLLISDNGTLTVKTTFLVVCSKNKKLKDAKSGFAKISFKSRKGSVHSFSIDRLPSALNPCYKALGKIHLSENDPIEAIDKSCIITFNKGRWFCKYSNILNSRTRSKVK